MHRAGWLLFVVLALCWPGHSFATSAWTCKLGEGKIYNSTTLQRPYTVQAAYSQSAAINRFKAAGISQRQLYSHVTTVKAFSFFSTQESEFGLGNSLSLIEREETERTSVVMLHSLFVNLPSRIYHASRPQLKMGANYSFLIPIEQKREQKMVALKYNLLKEAPLTTDKFTHALSITSGYAPPATVRLHHTHASPRPIKDTTYWENQLSYGVSYPLFGRNLYSYLQAQVADRWYHQAKHHQYNIDLQVGFKMSPQVALVLGWQGVRGYYNHNKILLPRHYQELLSRLNGRLDSKFSKNGWAYNGWQPAQGTMVNQVAAVTDLRSKTNFSKAQVSFLFETDPSTTIALQFFQALRPKASLRPEVGISISKRW
jgi:hypothetical protein